MRISGDFCSDADRFQVMRVTGVCGDRINSEPYEENGKPVVLSLAHSRHVLKQPDDYLLINLAGVSGTATIKRTDLGVQHL